MISKSTTAPLLIYGSRHGSLYNLTPTNLPKVIPSIQLSYGDFHDYMQTIKSLPEGMSFKKFLSYPQKTITYLTPYDFSKPDCMSGCHYDTKVKIKCNKGYTEVTASMYDTLVDLIKPDYYVGLTQYPSLQKSHKQQSNKSLKRAINKTKSYLQLSKYTRSQQDDINNEQKKPVRLAAVHGGTNLSLVMRSLQQILDYAIDGLVICDLCQGQTIGERQEAYNTIIKRLQQQYTRQNSYFKNKKLKLVLSGNGHLHDIEHALKFGFEAFQINYPFILAQKQQVLTFNQQKLIYEGRVPVKTPSLKPLDQSCKCYTCLNHSQAYIAHLIQCYELTAKVLLSIHNTHIYQNWLEQYKKKNQIE